jgi:hypothetical protein
MSDIERLKKELEEIKQEIASLKEGSRAYKALEEEKARLEAQLEGDGAKAVGKGGLLIEGSFQGNIYMGGEIKDNARALEIYRHMVRRSTSNLPLRGVDVGAADPSQAQQSNGTYPPWHHQSRG